MESDQQNRAPAPRVVAWESTQACNLACVHCRASAQTEPAPDELTTAEIKAVIDNIAAFASPILIISGGEPLMRPDIFEVARYASDAGLRVAMSPNGTLITEAAARAMREAGVARISVSIDASHAALHDRIRGVPGAFDDAMRGVAIARQAGVGVQFNTTVLRQNLHDLPTIHRFAVEQDVAAWHIFMLVPTGRGASEKAITPAEYEETLRWVAETTRTSPIPLRVTCGPQFQRIVATERVAAAPDHGPSRGHPGARRPRHGGSRPGHPHAPSRGCMAGDGYCFISHSGAVYPCGYLPLSAGNVRQQSFQSIYQTAPLFQTLRDLANLEGRCGECEFTRVCGGCRARAYGVSGNHLGEDPLCVYQPRATRGSAHAR
jgi:heme b synthase